MIGDTIEKQVIDLNTSGERMIMRADFIIKNGKVFHKNRPWIDTSVAIAAGKIIAVGTETEVASAAGPDTEVIDAGGRSILPGFIDSHLHATMCTELYITKLIYDIERGEGESRQDYIEKMLRPVKEYAAENPDLPIVRATGWNPGLFQADPQGMPTRHDVDTVCADRPVMLRSYDHHSVLVNTKALEMAGINADTPTPRNSEMLRDESGMPTGLFQEMPAICLLLDSLDIADFSVEEYMEGILKFQEDHAFFHGLSGIFDAYATQNAIEAYRRLALSGKLKMRVRTALLADLSKPFSQFSQMAEEKGKYDVGDIFKIETVKFFCDGGGFTFYMNEPFETKILAEVGYPPDYRGFPQWSEDEMKEACLVLAKGGYQIHMHCMGDAAVRQALNCYEYIEQNGIKGRRNSIAHIMNIAENDIRRMARLNVVGSIQPTWAIIDSFSDQLMIPLLGRKRTYEQYPIGRLLKAGVVVASGTDFPIVPDLNPMMGIQIGMTRTVPKSLPGYAQYKGIVSGPEGDPSVECLNLAEMIESYTASGAYQMFVEDITGAIEVGKSADLVILDSDIAAVHPMDIGEIKVDTVIFKGQKVKRTIK